SLNPTPKIPRGIHSGDSMPCNRHAPSRSNYSCFRIAGSMTCCSPATGRRPDRLAQPRYRADAHGQARLACSCNRPQGSRPAPLGRLSPMPEPRLQKLPDRTPVKIAIALMPGLHQELCDYAEVYRDTYGEAEPVAELIP